MSTDPCGGDVKGGSGCVCDPPFAGQLSRIGNDAARFLSKVEQTEGCWLWRGTVSGAPGRPQPVFRIAGPDRLVYAYRWLYEQIVGPVPDGHWVVATCRDPLCVRPALGHRVVMDRSEAARFAGVGGSVRRTHCARGHEFTPENSRPRLDGSRACWACQRDRDAARETPHQKRR